MSNLFCLNRSVMYADDLLLLSISITDLHCLIGICSEALNNCNLVVDVQKTS